MRFTNKLGIPGPLAKALKRDDYTLAGADISVTGTIKPPQMRQLELRHAKKIVVDVSDRIFMLLGKVIHDILDKSVGKNEIAEQIFVRRFMGVKVKAQSDLFERGGVLSDYKVSSVFAFRFEKPDWIAQGNLYAFFWRLAKYVVKRLRIVGIVRDWRYSEWRQNPREYPRAAFVVLELPLWSKKKQEKYLLERLRMHKRAEKLTDKQLAAKMPCSPAERWARPDTWAVKKRKNKRAIRGGVCFTKKKAKQLLRRMGRGFKIEARPGESIRCARGYCTVAPFCRQWRKIKNESKGR